MTTLLKPNDRCELQNVRGVGPVNATLLKAKNISTVQQLQQMYHDNFKADQHQMEQFLYVRWHLVITLPLVALRTHA